MRQAILLLIFAISVCAFGSEPTPKLPSRDPAVVVPLLRALLPESTYQDVLRILGKPDSDIGSATPNAIFKLADGSHVHVATRGALPDDDYKVLTIFLDPPLGAVTKHEGELLFDGPDKRPSTRGFSSLRD